MKKILLLCLLAMFGLSVQAQYFYLPPVNTGSNPGGLNNDDEFPLGGGLDPTWTGIQGTSATPVWTANQTIPFTFNFNGNPVTQYKVSTTGVLTFTTSASAVPGTNNTAIPSASIPDNSIMVWGINGSGSNDNIAIKTFGTAPNRQHWIFFTSYSYPGLTGWNYFSIVLEEGTDKIYIVDQRNNQTPTSVNLTVGVQIDNSTAIQDVNSPNTNPNAQSSLPDRSDNWYWEFIPGTQAQYDLTVDANTMNQFLNLNSAPFDVTGSITNLGSATVTSMDLNYSVDGGPVVSTNLTGLNISSFGTYNFTHPTQWNPSASQAYTIDIWASNINGNPDGNPSNDTLTSIIQVVDTVLDRSALHEVFTSSSCGPCNPGNANLNTVWANSNEEPVIMKYQMSWPGNGDPYYTLEGFDRRQYYGVNSVPNMAVDGGWNGNTNSYTTGLLSQFSAVPSFMDIHSEIRVECKTVLLDITVTPYSDFPGNNVLHVGVIENLTFNNVSTNGETEFDNVMKKMIPDANGTSIGPLTKNVPQTFTFAYTFNGNYILPPNAGSPVNHANNHTVEEFWDLDVVAFVQENTTKEVFQATYSVDMVGYDVSLNTFQAINNATVGSPVPITGEIENWKDSITSSVRINYSVDNGTPVSQTLTTNNFDSKGDVQNYTFVNSWIPNTPGTHTVKVWIDDFNSGNSVDNSPCNDTLTQTVNVGTASGPTADFNFTVNGLQVDFTDASTGANSWSWDFDDGNTSTQQDPTHTYTSSGAYNVCLVAGNNVGTDTICKSVNVTTVGLSGDSRNFIRIHPNPSQGVFEIFTNNDARGQVRIYDMLGREILMKENYNSNSIRIDLSDQDKGMYILRFSTNGTEYTERLILE